MHKCQYCDSDFASKVSLNKHQKSAKYCIDMRKEDDCKLDIDEFKCEWCSKAYTRKDRYYDHTRICKTNPENMNKIISKADYNLLLENFNKQREENIELKIKLTENINSFNETKNENVELKIKLATITVRLDELTNSLDKSNQENIELKIKNAELTATLKGKTELSEKFETLHSKREECIEKIALQPKNTTTKNTSNTQNNILNNLPIFNLTKEKLQLIASTEFTHELFLRGQEGAAKFATNIARKENDGDLPWVVSDKNRGIVKMKGEGGIIITDYDVEIITDLIFEAIKDKNQEYFDAAYPPYDSDAEELDPDEAERVEANKARADKCFSDIAKMKRNNKVFKKKLIEYSL